MLSAPRRRDCLLLAGAAVGSLGGCGVAIRQTTGALDAAQRSGAIGRSGRLTPEETAWAKVAWRYVENNTDLELGLVGGTDRKPLLATEDIAHALAALVAARELDVVEGRQFDARLSRILGFLGTMDLSGGQVPARFYNAGSGKSVNAENQLQDSGWSALGVGRLLLWLRILGQRHPAYREYADKAVLRWSFCDVLDSCGVLRSRREGRLEHEGQFGAEQLAAAGFAAWGFDTAASSALPMLESVNVDGTALPAQPADGRPMPVLVPAHLTLGIELGWDLPAAGPAMRAIAERVMEAQAARWRRTDQYTARSPYRGATGEIVDTMWGSGYAWNTLTADGKEVPERALVSTRAAFGMWALWPNRYTDELMEVVRFLHDPDRGWFEGRLERTGAPETTITLATNSAVLEALLFKVKGQMASRTRSVGYFERRLADRFERIGRCLPHERPGCKPAPS